MKKSQFDFKFVEKQVRTKSFGILTTLNQNGTPHTTGVLFGVANPSSKLSLYIATSLKYKKVRNIIKNPHVSFLIPFPHYYIRFAPSATVTFNGEAELVSIENSEIQDIFSKKRILRLILDHLNTEEKKSYTFLRIKPYPKVLCYGLGQSILKLRKGHPEGGYSVLIS